MGNTRYYHKMINCLVNHKGAFLFFYLARIGYLTLLVMYACSLSLPFSLLTSAIEWYDDIRHRWTGRYEAHLWDKSTWNQNQNKKGKQGLFLSHIHTNIGVKPITDLLVISEY